MQNTSEIIVYHLDENNTNIEVHVENETVWLSLNQISNLFNRDKSVISRHLRNIYKEGELSRTATVAKNATVQHEAGRAVNRNVDFYNLDAILSVGYRVNSKQGTQFRIWATHVLRDFLLKGVVLNQRMDQIESNYEDLSREVKDISRQLKAEGLPRQGIFFAGQVFDAYLFAADLIKNAVTDIILIDNYIDETVLNLYTKRKSQVCATIYTRSASKQLQLDLNKHNSQYEPITIKTFTESHDRFLIIDRSEIYHLGASLKDLGKRWFAFSKLDLPVDVILSRLPE
jgi:hypothetical protein